MKESADSVEQLAARGGEVVANDEHRRLVPGFGGRISAALVWDGGEEVRVPTAMGAPREDQMRGTPRERLVEVALRICYDSMGTGRDSAKCHGHILDVRHWSVQEHAAFTVEWDAPLGYLFAHFLNKPCLYLRDVTPEDVDDGGPRFRATLNLRHVLEWGDDGLGDDVRAVGHRLAPQIAREPGVVRPGVRLVEPEVDEEKWITLYLTGSRGWSHELVRHGDWSAISQRSTRFVDESESEWVLHPLLAAYLEERIPAESAHEVIQLFECRDSRREATAAYDSCVSVLQPWLEARGVDKISARKQARGAARGLLGNALETEVIFSASVRQWRHMLSMRAADAADAEIRLGFAEAVLPCLRASRYGDRFADLELVPARDGIGRSLAGGGHK